MVKRDLHRKQVTVSKCLYVCKTFGWVQSMTTFVVIKAKKPGILESRKMNWRPSQCQDLWWILHLGADVPPQVQSLSQRGGEITCCQFWTAGTNGKLSQRCRSATVVAMKTSKYTKYSFRYKCKHYFIWELRMNHLSLSLFFFFFFCSLVVTGEWHFVDNYLGAEEEILPCYFFFSPSSTHSCYHFKVLSYIAYRGTLKADASFQ